MPAERWRRIFGKRVTLALDVWQSLLHMRWQFRDLTFWQLQFRTNTPIQRNDSGDGLKPTASAISSCVSSITSICATASELFDPLRPARNWRSRS
jgi:uncharacterized protein YhdP